jgi:DNA-binding CsgD family transcriptional regulator
VELLTDRQLQIFQMLGAGLSTRRIAAELSLSLKTIETHRENIKHKLGLQGAAALVQAATQWLGPRDAGPTQIPKRD